MNIKYLAIDAFGWAEDSDFLEAIRKREEDSGKHKSAMNVYRLDADKFPTYSICCYVPQIDATLVYSRDTEDYDSENPIFEHSFPNAELKNGKLI